MKSQHIKDTTKSLIIDIPKSKTKDTALFCCVRTFSFIHKSFDTYEGVFKFE